MAGPDLKPARTDSSSSELYPDPLWLGELFGSELYPAPSPLGSREGCPLEPA